MSAFNGAGTFVISGVGLPYVTGTTISSTVANQLNADLATGLSTCITKNGQTTPTANIPMGGFKITGLGAPGAAGDALVWGQPATVGALTAGGINAPSLTASGAVVSPLFFTQSGLSGPVTGVNVVANLLTLPSGIVSGWLIYAAVSANDANYSQTAIVHTNGISVNVQNLYTIAGIHTSVTSAGLTIQASQSGTGGTVSFNWTATRIA